MLFIIHMSLGIFYYILNTDCNEYKHGYWTFVYEQLKFSEFAKTGETPGDLCDFLEYLPLIYKIHYKILGFYSYITFHKIDVRILISVQIYIIEFLVTVLCAWRFFLYTCPGISSNQEKESKLWKVF
jgi:hypothetical protein